MTLTRCLKGALIGAWTLWIPLPHPMATPTVMELMWQVNDIGAKNNNLPYVRIVVQTFSAHLERHMQKVKGETLQL